MTTTKQLDIRAIPPPLTHSLIFQTFDALSVGECFHLINDHEPRPLFY